METFSRLPARCTSPLELYFPRAGATIRLLQPLPEVIYV